MGEYDLDIRDLRIYLERCDGEELWVELQLPREVEAEVRESATLVEVVSTERFYIYPVELMGLGSAWMLPWMHPWRDAWVYQSLMSENLYQELLSREGAERARAVLPGTSGVILRCKFTINNLLRYVRLHSSERELASSRRLSYLFYEMLSQISSGLSAGELEGVRVDDRDAMVRERRDSYI